jgi:hypothetical protein
VGQIYNKPPATNLPHPVFSQNHPYHVSARQRPPPPTLVDSFRRGPLARNRRRHRSNARSRSTPQEESLGPRHGLHSRPGTRHPQLVRRRNAHSSRQPRSAPPPPVLFEGERRPSPSVMNHLCSGRRFLPNLCCLLRMAADVVNFWCF